MKKILIIISFITLLSTLSITTFAKSDSISSDRDVAYITNQTEKIPYLSTGSSIANRNAIGIWHEDENGWKFEYSGGGYPHDTWEEIDHRWYYFKSDCYMATGWVQVKGVWYFCENLDSAEAPLGSMITGWRKIEGEWYFFETAGTDEVPLGGMRTGWFTKDSQTYYFRLTKENNHPEGSMVTGLKTIEGKDYFFNALGEKTVKLQNKNSATYVASYVDGTLCGGTVKWNLESYLTNEAPDKIKVTDRGVFCTYKLTNTMFPMTFNTKFQPDERDMHTLERKNIIWKSQDVMHPSDEVLAISISNHYDPEDSAQGNLSLYNKNEDVMLSYAYEFGRNEGIFAMTIKFETGEVEQLPVAWDIRNLRVPYTDLPASYNEENALRVENVEVIQNIGKTISRQKEPLFRIGASSNSDVSIKVSNSNAIFAGEKDEGNRTYKNNKVLIKKETLKALEQTAALYGVEEAEEYARQFVGQKGAVYAEAVNSGVSVSDEDVKKYQKKIKDSLELGSNSVFAEFVKGFGGEENYWNLSKDNYEKTLVIEEYLKKEKGNFMTLEGYKYNTLESEEAWNKYMNEKIHDLEEKYPLVLE